MEEEKQTKGKQYFYTVRLQTGVGVVSESYYTRCRVENLARRLTADSNEEHRKFLLEEQKDGVG